MNCIDFDARFADYLNTWLDENRSSFRNADEMEEASPEAYLRFLNEPADWLEGATPGEYFDRYESGSELCELLCQYVREEVPVPDPLCDRLAVVADEQALHALATDASAPIEARLHAMGVLDQLESTLPMVDYLRWQVERTEDEDLLNNAIDYLRNMGEDVVRPTVVAFRAAGDEGKEALLDVLCDHPGVQEAFDFALEQFKTCVNKRALYSSYLAKLGDDHALEALYDVAESDDVNYADFIEIRSAIERLGGEAPVRDFTGDPTYRALRRMQKK